jgi:CBS domain-containing protein
MSFFKDTRVKEFMTSHVEQVAPSAALTDVDARLRALDISCLAVVDKGALVGTVSRTDLLRVGRRRAEAPGTQAPRNVLLDFSSETVNAVMGKDVATVAEDSNLAQAASVMVDRGLHRVFVLGRDQLVGVLSTLDLMLAIYKAGSKETLAEFMSSEVVVTDVGDTVADATALLESSKISGLIVVENDWPVGVYTQVEALAAKDAEGKSLVEDAMDPALICMQVSTSMQRAAQKALRMRVRRIVAVENRHVRGVLSGMDFAALVAGRS